MFLYYKQYTSLILPQKYEMIIKKNNNNNIHDILS